MSILTTVYFISIRVFLHLIFGSTFYLIFLKFAKISKWSFAFLIMLPLAIIMEYYQHRIRVADDPNNFILVRDSLAVLFLIVGILALVFVKNTPISKEWIFIGLSILLMVILCVLEHTKPTGVHWEWKHFVDIIAWTAGPLLAYPIIHKLLG